MKSTKIPKELKTVLWSYNIDKLKLDNPKDKHLIITQVLNYGSFDTIKWLSKTYSLEDVRSVIRKPSRGIWLKSKILDKLRQNLFSRLSFLSDKDFYLAGGTALALYLGHRKSIDFDFYSKEEFNAVLIEKAHLFKGVKIASIEDIAAMKTVAIVDRARQREEKF